jgi:ornithine cyclodeaminase/alanine dehydrogenase-like protein (mu-crystallin family)
MLLLTDEVIQGELSMRQVIELVEQAFAADAHGNARTFPAIVEYVGMAHAHFGIKSGYLRVGASDPGGAGGELPGVQGGQEVLGLKAGGYWAANQDRHGLPKHRATILLLNPDTGEALAVMAANVITRLRTAAAGAVAARYLARRDATVVAVLGTGEQAHAQVEALQLVRDISTLYVWGRQEAAIQDYVAEWRRRGVDAQSVLSLRDALAKADIVVTTTPSTAPLVLNEWIVPGTHINAVGSDGAGKRELDPSLIKRSKFVPDKILQSTTIGELQGVAQGGADPRTLVHAELGQICARIKPGRETDTEITIFDSSGVSFQDLVVAHYLVGVAKEKKIGQIV